MSMHVLRHSGYLSSEAKLLKNQFALILTSEKKMIADVVKSCRLNDTLSNAAKVNSSLPESKSPNFKVAI